MIESAALNVKDFGAVGDGVTDDRVAIQNAVNAAIALGASTVYLPTGIYSVSRCGIERALDRLLCRRLPAAPRRRQGEVRIAPPIGYAEHERRGGPDQ